VVRRSLLAAALMVVATATAATASVLSDPTALVLDDPRASAAAKRLVQDPGPFGGIIDSEVIRRDLTGDHVPDLIVPVLSGGTSGVEHYFVYTEIDGQARDILARNNLFGAGITVSSGRLIEELPYYDADDAGCCPSRIAITIYGWNGTRLVVRKRGTRILRPARSVPQPPG
jgi:hypothetical protein